VSLTKARLLVGAVYLGSARGVSGGQDAPCILPGTYVAQATDGEYVDLLSSAPQRFPSPAHGTLGRAPVAQVFLASGDVDAVHDAAPVLDVEGTATRDGDVRPFRGTITIGANRLSPGASAGAASPCHLRIVDLNDANVVVASQGGLLLRVDPRGLFARVDFGAMEAPVGGATYTLPDDTGVVGGEIYGELASGREHAYAMTWVDGLDDAPIGVPIPRGQGSGTCSFGPTASDGFALQTFCPPADPGAGGVLFTASGERLALAGYDFPAVRDGDAAFVDGWEVRFARILVTVDKLRLAENPDRVPGDESQTDGVVAEVDGPWAVDLSRSDPSYLEGKGGSGEQAVPIAALGSSLTTDGTRYAFDFDVVPATASAQNVNLDGAAMDDYEAMTKSGCTVLYVGTATFKGDKTDAACYPPDRRGWPDVIDFRLCFQSPTSYVNCQNPDNDPAAALPGEEHERGLALRSGQSVVAQVTIHTDHPFWDSVLHDSPAHFDPLAARVSNLGAGDDGGARPMVTLDMLRGVDFGGIRDADGNALEWRYCMNPPTDVHPKLTGPMRLDAQSVPRAIGADPSTGLRDQYDFATYDQSTQGHMNSDGLCYVKRDYPSPP
jgi:hypothetical protein